ncbi:MAG: arylamine N-acetyltransferase [Candidatus Promineifilaceae bacterium]
MTTTNLSMPPGFLDRYLSLLGIPRRAPSMAALHEVVQAHVMRVPFENISKLYYKKHNGLRGLPDLEQFLDGIERFHFGGTCYANNYYLYLLLRDLGYQARLCGADMSNPDVHLVSMVTVENREFLVDAGYAAPFLNPLPRDLATDYTITLGRDRHVLKPQDGLGRSRMELYRDGQLKHGYLAKPEARQIHEFERAIAGSYRDEATFMNALLLARFFPDRSLVIHNLTVIESRGASSEIFTLDRPEELARVVQDNFAIPGQVVDDALSGLTQLGDAWD